MKRLRITAVAVGLLAAAAGTAYAAGLFPGFPIVGGASYSAGLVTVPAGPVAVAPGYVIPADTALTQGQNPATVLIPVEQLALFTENGQAPVRNFLRNGDTSVNPFQRLAGNTNVENFTNAAPLPTLPMVAGTIAGGPDGFSIKGGSGTAQLVYSKQTAPASVVAGQFTASYRLRRQTGSVDTAQECTHSVVQSANAVSLAGNKVVYSFWAHAGTGFNSTNSAITANLIAGTGTDQGAASMQAGTWTGQSTPATSAILLTNTWTQYVLAGTIPAGTNEVGIDICWTPNTNGAGTSDFIETANHQLEAVSGNVVSPSVFEHHTAQFDLQSAQAYLVVFNEGTNAGAVLGSCALQPAVVLTTCEFPAPVTMRTTPTTGNSTPMTAGSFKLMTGGTNSPIAGLLVTQMTATMLGVTLSSIGTLPANFAWGSVGAGQLVFSAELL